MPQSAWFEPYRLPEEVRRELLQQLGGLGIGTREQHEQFLSKVEFAYTYASSPRRPGEKAIADRLAAVAKAARNLQMVLERLDDTTESLLRQGQILFQRESESGYEYLSPWSQYAENLANAAEIIRREICVSKRGPVTGGEHAAFISFLAGSFADIYRIRPAKQPAAVFSRCLSLILGALDIAEPGETRLGSILKESSEVKPAKAAQRGRKKKPN